MIQITPQMRILMSVEAVDFRKGIDGLCGICRVQLSKDPFSGTVFVFVNRRRTAIKVLIYDGQGFWLCQKRLSKGRFKWWPKQNSDQDKSPRALAVHELQLLIWNGNPGSAEVEPCWKKIQVEG